MRYIKEPITTLIKYYGLLKSEKLARVSVIIFEKLLTLVTCIAYVISKIEKVLSKEKPFLHAQLSRITLRYLIFLTLSLSLSLSASHFFKFSFPSELVEKSEFLVR